MYDTTKILPMQKMNIDFFTSNRICQQSDLVAYERKIMLKKNLLQTFQHLTSDNWFDELSQTKKKKKELKTYKFAYTGSKTIFHSVINLFCFNITNQPLLYI